jgi:hypothetical protein
MDGGLGGRGGGLAWGMSRLESERAGRNGTNIENFSIDMIFDLWYT